MKKTLLLLSALFSVMLGFSQLPQRYDYIFQGKVGTSSIDSIGDAPHAMYRDPVTGYFRIGRNAKDGNNYPTGMTLVGKTLNLSLNGLPNLSVNIPYPDQIVLTGGGIATVTGTYPNMLITVPPYDLPAATTTTLGGIRVGSGLQVSNGTLSVIPGGVDLSNYLAKDQNLADVPNKVTARANLGLAAVASSGSYNDLLNKPTLTNGTVTYVGMSSADLTLSGSPITTAGTITANIANNAVSFAKVQQIPTASLIGRYSAGTGNAQSITLGSGLALNATTGVLSATGGGGGGGTLSSVGLSSTDLTVTGSPLTTNGSITANIANNAVTFSKMQQLPAGTLIGRNPTVAGNAESIAIGSGLSMSGTTLNATPYNLPIASATVLGGIKVGAGLSINAGTGVLTGTGEANTAANVGTGQGLYRDKIGINLNFKSLVATAPLVVSPGTDQLTISSTQSSTNSDGYLRSVDWNLFNSKVSPSRSITAGTGLTGGGDLSQDRSIGLANTGVAAGTYSNPTLTLNAQGQVVSASAGNSVSAETKNTGVYSDSYGNNSVSGAGVYVVPFTTGLSAGTAKGSFIIPFSTTSANPNSFSQGDIVEIEIQGSITSSTTSTLPRNILFTLTCSNSAGSMSSTGGMFAPTNASTVGYTIRFRFPAMNATTVNTDSMSGSTSAANVSTPSGSGMFLTSGNITFNVTATNVNSGVTLRVNNTSLVIKKAG